MPERCSRTEIAVWEMLATEVSTRFLAEFLGGASAGEALRVPRGLLARRNPLGLGLHLYALGEFAVVPAPRGLALAGGQRSSAR